MNIAFIVNHARANNYVHVNLELFVWSVLEKDVTSFKYLIRHLMLGLLICYKQIIHHTTFMFTE